MGVMKRLHKIIVLLSLCSGLSYAQEYIYTLSTDIDNLNVYEENGYDRIDLLDASCMSEIVGDPMLPIKKIKVVIPDNSSISDIHIISLDEQEISGTYNISPVSPPSIISLQYYPSMFINENIYQNDDFYPFQIIENLEEGLLAGTKIAELNYFPVRYNPVTKKIKVIVNVVFRINLKYASSEKRKITNLLSPFAFDYMVNHIKNSVINPNEVNQNLNILSDGQMINNLRSISKLQEPKIDYIIVTADSLSSGFQEIADWKTKKGLNSKVISIEWISCNFNGSDLPEKIRNFIKHAFHNWGTLWYLIGGDTDVVPIRYAWISHFNHFQLKNNRPQGELIPTDMYYSCLDGTWNADEDMTFGEADWDRQNNGTFVYVSSNANIDNVDRIPDVFVGRIPVKNNGELQSYKIKYFKYLKGDNINPNKALVFSANSDYIYSSGMNTVASRFPDSVNVTKMYECIDNYNTYCATKSDVLNALNTNSQYHIICGYGHGGVTAFEACDASITKYEINNLQNDSCQGQILYNNHCETMAWDKSCVGEQYVNITNGGVVYIGNTRFGWTGDPTRYNHNFISEIYNKKRIGNAFYGAKGYGSSVDGTSRWGFFALNISGDPEMQVWTDTPQQLNVTVSPAAVQLGEQSVSVTISNLPAGESAMICVQKGTEVYYPMTVTSNDTYVLDFTVDTPGTIYVTVTAHNFVPKEKNVQANASAVPHLFVDSVDFIDDGTNGSVGNNNGQNDAGETIRLKTILKNSGVNAANAVTATLSSLSPHISISNNQANFGTIGSGQTATNYFLYTINSVAPNISANGNNPARLSLEITDINNTVWRDTFSIDVYKDSIMQRNKPILSTTNGDLIIEPNETVRFNIDLQCLGMGTSKGLSAVLTTTNSSNIIQSCPSTPRTYPDIAPFGTGQAVIPFEFTTGPAYNGNKATLTFNLQVTNAYGKTWNFPFNLSQPAQVNGSSIEFTADLDEIDLKWTNVTSVAGYNIYRCNVGVNDTEVGDYEKLNSVPVTFAFYNDTKNLSTLTKYYYKITTIKSDGNESEPTRKLAWTSYPRKSPFPVTLDNSLGNFKTPINVADINGDGKKEIFAGTRGGNDKGFLVGLDYLGNELYDIDNNVTTYSGFAKLGKAAWAIPAIGDLNRMGKSQIVEPTREYGADVENALFCYSMEDINPIDGKPDLLWSNYTTEKQYLKGVVLSNIDNSPDGSMEIITTSDERGSISVYNSQGVLLTNIAAANTYGYIAVADLDEKIDGKKEIIHTANNGIYVWHHDGSNYQGANPFYSTPLTGYNFVGSPVVCDIDGDGHKDILAFAIENKTPDSSPSTAKLFGVKNDGSTITGFNGSITINTSCDWYQDLSVGDLNNDGNLEIVTLAKDAVKIWNNQGQLIISIPITGLYGGDTPILGDVNGDDLLEVIFTMGNLIYAYGIDGNLSSGFPLRSSEVSCGGLCISDIDGDNKTEILVTANNKIEMWQTDGSPSKIEWGSQRHDQYNTGEYYQICEPTFITSSSTWSTNQSLCNDLVIKSGNLTINNNSNVTMTSNSMVIVMAGATLTIDSGHILNANVKALAGSNIIIRNNGSILLRSNGEFEAEAGANVEIFYGSIDK